MCKKCVEESDKSVVKLIEMNNPNYGYETNPTDNTSKNDQDEFTDMHDNNNCEYDGENLLLPNDMNDDDSSELQEPHADDIESLLEFNEGSDVLTRQNLEQYITSTEDLDMPHCEIESESCDFNYCMPTTNAGEYGLKIRYNDNYSGAFGDIKVSGHVILNQNGSLLTRKKYQIKGSSRHKFFYKD